MKTLSINKRAEFKSFQLSVPSEKLALSEQFKPNFKSLHPPYLGTLRLWWK